MAAVRIPSAPGYHGSCRPNSRIADSNVIASSKKLWWTSATTKVIAVDPVVDAASRSGRGDGSDAQRV